MATVIHEDVCTIISKAPPTGEFLRAVLDALPVGVIVLNEQRVPVQWNRKCIELQGVTPGSSAWLNALHPEDREHVVASWNQASEKGEEWAAVYRFVHSGGKTVWVSGRATPIRVNNETIGYVRTLEDVSDLKEAKDRLRTVNEQLQFHTGKLEEEVQQRTEKLQEALAELDRLSYSIVHDMRAPLRTLQGFSSLLLETYGPKLDQQGEDMLQRIAEAAKKQDELIEGVLAYHSYLRDKFPLSPVSIDRTVENILYTYANLQPGKADINVKTPLGWAMANETLLSQTLSALLNNAVKFVAPETHPEICIWSESSHDNIMIWVGDNGIGIAPEYHGRIFDVFQTLHDSRTYPGRGVGLPLAKKAMERMGGELGVDSKVGKGSLFWIKLRKVTA